jgi:hypothetical protein
MGEENKERVMSQAEIDTLVNVVDKKRPPLTPVPPTVEIPVANPVPQPTPAGNPPVAVQSLPNTEEIKKLQENIEWLKSEISILKIQIEEILANGVKEHGCSLLSGFQCGGCNAQNLVAMYARCTKCGKETWLGYWPQQ